MPTEIIMPQLDQTMTEGKVGKWLVKEGESVSKGTPIVEIETDKVVNELEAPADGVLAQIIASEGSKVPVKGVLAIIASQDEAIQQVGVKTAPTTKVRPEVVQPVAERIKASPAAKNLAQQHGIDLNQLRGSGPGGRIVIEDVQRYIDSSKRDFSTPTSERIKVSPLAKRLAIEHGIDLTTITGTGPGDRIIRDDVLKDVEAKIPPAPFEKEVTKPPQAPPAEVEIPAERVVPLTGVRQIIAERMAQSAHTAAIVTLNTEVDATSLVEMRQRLNEKAELTGVSVSYTDLLVKIIALALRKHPMLNSTLSEDGIHLLKDINIGVAIALDENSPLCKGHPPLEDGAGGILIVPVVRHADKKTLSEISKEIEDMVQKARNKSLTPEAVQGGTFTLTNLGMFGVDTFTPIINPPQCAILGVGRIIKKPVVLDDEIVLRTMMGLSLSFDHRIVDGAPAAQFLQTISQLIAEPYLMML
ncbi:TPA: 2-oxo acid dehydrogenase subunit E2 [Candidatus Poribacteria bacterium]|nr:2-oxo acid dehydrogenase subunit E2 [Candidatus Poribacteria bacterium]